MKISRRSQLSGEVNSLSLPITAAEYRLWQGGHLLYSAFADRLNAEQAVFLLTGMTAQEAVQVFGPHFPIRSSEEEKG